MKVLLSKRRLLAYIERLESERRNAVIEREAYALPTRTLFEVECVDTFGSVSAFHSITVKFRTRKRKEHTVLLPYSLITEIRNDLRAGKFMTKNNPDLFNSAEEAAMAPPFKSKDFVSRFDTKSHTWVPLVANPKEPPIYDYVDR